MKAYLIVTGIVFAMITAAHVWRVAAEGPALAKNPLFLALTALAAGLTFWACGLLWRSARP
jgi:hypothetical protein